MYETGLTAGLFLLILDASYKQRNYIID